MLFDAKPKEKLKDFFNYREELTSLTGYLTDKTTRMVVIRGLRRTGKSSLLKVGLNLSKSKFIILDARELISLSRKSFEFKLLEELKSIKNLPHALLERIEGVDVGVRISLKNEEGLWKLLKTMNPVIAVDEVQMLKGTGVEAFFAAVYDNTDCKIILTGSEVGVLDKFVGKDDPKAPLFGRVYREIKMHPLVSQKSSEFLISGFKEAGVEISEEMLTDALRELDGIVGWLTSFGNISLTMKPRTALEKTIKTGAELAYSELDSFLNLRLAAKNRYLSLVRILAGKSFGWADLKRALQLETGETTSDSQFSNYLNSLTAYGFVILSDDIYSIPDPLLKKALRGGLSN